MKTAILLATRKGDSLAVKFLMHAAFSEVLADFKDRVATDRGEPGYDSLEIWTGPPVKTASRLSSGDQDLAAILIVPGEGLTAEQAEEIAKAWAETHAELTGRISDLEEQLATLQTKFHDATSSEVETASGEGGAPSPTELPDTAQAGTGEGNLAGAQATSDEPELPLGTPPAADPPADPAQPGSMSPAKKKGK